LTGDRVLSPGRVSDVSASQALGCIRLLRRGVASIDVGQSYVAVCFDFAPRAAVHDGVGVRLAAVDLDYSATALPDNGGPTPCNVPPRIRTTSADLFSDEGRCVPISTCDMGGCSSSWTASSVGRSVMENHRGVS